MRVRVRVGRRIIDAGSGSGRQLRGVTGFARHQRVGRTLPVRRFRNLSVRKLGHSDPQLGSLLDSFGPVSPRAGLCAEPDQEQQRHQSHAEFPSKCRFVAGVKDADVTGRGRRLNS